MFGVWIKRDNVERGEEEDFQDRTNREEEGIYSTEDTAGEVQELREGPAGGRV